MNIIDFKHLLQNRVLILDGAMGTMIQKFDFGEEDFRCGRFLSHPIKLAGCNDILCISRPEAIKSIHKRYLDAGADIISTNSFNANAVSMADYGLERYPGLIREINREAAALARSVAESAPPREWGGRAMVAGSVGPTNRTASMSPDVSDPSARNIDYDQLYEAFHEQVAGLLEGGADIILFETVFDTLNLKAGIDAANHVMAERGEYVPIMVSATLSDKTGRTLSGQTMAAFVTSIEDCDNVVSIGLNCSSGPVEMLPFLRELGTLTDKFISAHPNAGLPNAIGEYDVTADIFSANLAEILREGLVNIAGGCCGTTPSHIAALCERRNEAAVRRPAEKRPALRISGLEMVEVMPENRFLNVGERCNVAGSRKFLRLIKEKKYEEAMGIALRQVEDGAMVIDINMDDALLDAREEMVHFLRYMASEPDIARVPVMVDSSDWEVVEAALKNIQGKSIVNSISLKEGEEVFVHKARRIKELGGAVIVMAFDEQGQADTYLRKTEICERAYKILTTQCGIKSDDIIFDVNVMAVATGIEEHNRYAIDFIKAVEWIKNNLPGVRTSGGISNLSFAFRGKNYLRDAMHAVFLYHAIAAGLDMGIVNPSTSVTYDDIEPDLRNLLEDVILARRPEAAEELAAYAAAETMDAGINRSGHDRDMTLSVGERLRNAIIKGNGEFLEADLDEALGNYPAPAAIIEGPLMEGMDRVGELFGDGKMFLPQVVKTARTMKQAVDYLRPFMEKSNVESGGKKAGKVLFATVKGDVHDIGKNIVSIVLACNNYEVIDLGVMVPAEEIVDTAVRERPDLVCLSGLITPSLSEMVNVAKAMEAASLEIPILVGGATTSKVHTALKISPVYSGPVVHVSDASQNPIVATRLLNRSTHDEFVSNLDAEYSRLRKEYAEMQSPLLPFREARESGFRNRLSFAGNPLPNTQLGEPLLIDIDLREVVRFINWKMLFHAWRLTGRFIEDFPYDGCPACVAQWEHSLSPEDRDKAHEAYGLYRDARNLIANLICNNDFDGRAAVAFYYASSQGENIKIGETVIPLLRQQRKDSRFKSLADYVAREDDGVDYVGVFCVTSGNYMAQEACRLKNEGDGYGALLIQSVSDRIVEAASEWLHCRVRREYWGYASDESKDIMEMLKGDYRGIRPAMGYPMLPDQLLNYELEKLLPFDKIGVSLTENGAMTPSATVSGLYIAHPDAVYFMVGDIGDDQLKDYSRRRGIDEKRLREVMRM